jgi:hypothetical protein
MNLLICVLHNDTANSTDCVTWSVWLMSGEWKGKICNDCVALTGSTIAKLSSTDRLKTISITDRYPADCRTQQYQSERETHHDLKRSGCLQIVNWSELEVFYIFAAVYVSFVYLQYKAPSPDNRFTSFNIICNSYILTDFT